MSRGAVPRRRRAVFSNAKTRWGVIIVAVIGLSTILAPLLTPFGPEQITDEVLASPGLDQLFGTDRRAMDVFTRTLYAPRVDLTIGLAATLIAFFVGGVNETLPVRVLNMMQGQVSPRINAVGSVVFAVSITLVILAQVFLLTRRGTGRLKAPV